MKSISDMPKPHKNAIAIRQTFSDGNHRLVYCTDIEHPYPNGRLIVSRTDIHGILTHVNDVFIELSGYHKDELIGQSHCIVRHPDMPKAIFADLWQTIKAGKKWHGYIKNLCKDGGYYWVYATVIPNVRRGEVVGYTSVRRKPNHQKVMEAINHYQQLKQQES